MKKFSAKIDIIGINPFVFVPEEVLAAIFKKAKKSTSPIPIKGKVNGKPYKQTLVKYAGKWRLYINTSMLKNSPKRIGETIEITISYDPEDRSITPHPKFVKALKTDKTAQAAFKKLPTSRQNEIVRYISHLKTAQSVEKNVARAINYLKGKGSFVGRKKL